MLLSRSVPVVSAGVRVVRLAVWGRPSGARFSVRFRFWLSPGVVGEVLCVFRSRASVSRLLSRFVAARVAVRRFSSAWSPSALPFPRFGLRWLALRSCSVSVFGVFGGRVCSRSFSAPAASLGSLRLVAFSVGGLVAFRSARGCVSLSVPLSSVVRSCVLSWLGSRGLRLRC